MKYTLILLLISTQCFGQIDVDPSPVKTTIGEVKRTGSVLRLYVYPGNDSMYFLTFKNREYQHISDYSVISFKNEDGALEKFYQILKSVFEGKKDKDYSVDFSLGIHKVSVGYFKSLGKVEAIFITPKGYTTFSEKDIDKLFGK